MPSSTVMLDSARRKTLAPALARWLLGPGIAANPAANVTHGLGHGLAGGAVAAWPAVALVCSCELLMMIIRNPHAPANSVSGAALPAALSDLDPVQVRGEQVFAEDLAACRVPSVRAIRVQLHVGQARTQRIGEGK